MAFGDGVVGVLDRFQLDALVMPTFASFHLPAIAGLPVITVPLGFYPSRTAVEMNIKGTLVDTAPNVPFGIAFIGRSWSEETLISLAYAFEQRTMVRKKMRPYIEPTFELGDKTSATPPNDLVLRSDSTSFPTKSEITQAIIKRVVGGLISPRTWALSLGRFAGGSI